MADLVAAVVCCAGIPMFVTFGAGAVLAAVGATLCKPQILPGWPYWSPRSQQCSPADPSEAPYPATPHAGGVKRGVYGLA